MNINEKKFLDLLSSEDLRKLIVQADALLIERCEIVESNLANIDIQATPSAYLARSEVFKKANLNKIKGAACEELRSRFNKDEIALNKRASEVYSAEDFMRRNVGRLTLMRDVREGLAREYGIAPTLRDVKEAVDHVVSELASEWYGSGPLRDLIYFN